MQGRERLRVSALAKAVGRSSTTVSEWVIHKGLPRGDDRRIAWADYVEWKDAHAAKAKKSFRRKMGTLKLERVNDNTPTTVYQVIDPKDGEPIYYGITRKPLAKRWYGHRSHFNRRKHGNRQMMRLWHARIKEGYGELRIEAVGIYPGWKAGQVEQQHIDAGRERIGRRLCNVLEGGQGGARTPEAKKSISDALKAKWQDPEYRAKCVKHNGSEKRKSAMRRRAMLKAGFTDEDAWMEYRKDRDRKARSEYEKQRTMNKRGLFQTLTLIRIGDVAILPLSKGRRAVIKSEHADMAKRYVWRAHEKYGRWSPRTNGLPCMEPRSSSGKKPTKTIIMPQPYEIYDPDGLKMPTCVPKVGI